MQMAAKVTDLRVKPSQNNTSPQTEGRNEELCNREDIRTTLNELYAEVLQGFEDQVDRSNKNIDYWGQFHAELGSDQFYSGTSQVCVPLVHDAIMARKTRFSNQIFPQSGRYVEVTTTDGTMSHSHIALVEHYIRKCNLQTQVIPALMKAGDVEGQYTVYVDWQNIEREVAWRVQKNPQLEATEEEDAEEEEDEALFDPTETVDDIEEQVIKVGYPIVEVISDSDILVLPATSDSIDEALENGGSVTILRRWTKSKIKQMIKDKHIDKTTGDAFLKELANAKDTLTDKDAAKEALEAAGIKKDSRGLHGLVYETWTKINVKGKRRIHKIYFGGRDAILSCKRNPLWSDKLPIISAPVEKEHGVFKGISKVKPVYDFQLLANDAVNEGMDSAAYALMPIVMTDPVQNPRIGSMILSLAAIWETSPKDTQFVNFPPLWKDAFEIVLGARNQVFQTLGVNPAMITQSTGAKKPTQADIAQEQQVDILTTAEAVTTVENGILTPMVQRMLELDHQYRTDAISVRQYGELGVTAKMQRVDPIQLGDRIYLRWYGVEAARNAQQVQQQTAAVNVLRGIPPQLYPGYELDLTPAIVQLVENAFGPRLAPLIFKDLKSQLQQNPELENVALTYGIDLPAHRFDNHQEHMMLHLQALKETGDPTGTIRAHIMRHHLIMGGGPQMSGGVPGAPGGAGPGLPGQAGPGSPRMGGQPAQATGGQGPPGMIGADQLVDPSRMPQ